MIILDLPVLESFYFNNQAFAGNLYRPEKNELILKNMPQLKQMKMSESLRFFGKAIIKGGSKSFCS